MRILKHLLYQVSTRGRLTSHLRLAATRARRHTATPTPHSCRGRCSAPFCSASSTCHQLQDRQCRASRSGASICSEITQCRICSGPWTSLPRAPRGRVGGRHQACAPSPPVARALAQERIPGGPSPSAYRPNNARASARRSPPRTSRGLAKNGSSTGGSHRPRSSAAPSFGDSSAYHTRRTPSVIAAPIHIKQGSRLTASVRLPTGLENPSASSASSSARRSAWTTRLPSVFSWVYARPRTRSPSKTTAPIGISPAASPSRAAARASIIASSDPNICAIYSPAQTVGGPSRARTELGPIFRNLSGRGSMASSSLWSSAGSRGRRDEALAALVDTPGEVLHFRFGPEVALAASS